MSTVSDLRKLLADEYGISSDRELNRALTAVKGIGIGVFTAPVRENAYLTQREKTTNGNERERSA